MAGKRPLTNAQIKAAHLVVEDRLTDEEIAAEVGTSIRQFYRWKRSPAFVAETTRITKAFNAALIGVGVATHRRRVEAINDRWHRMQRLIEARAKDPETARIPGGETGLLVKQLKGIGKGKDFKVVEEFAVDTGLLREMREHERQAAMELGQWVEKVAPTNPEGDREYGELTEPERVAKLAQIFDSIRTRADRQAPESQDQVEPESGPAN